MRVGIMVRKSMHTLVTKINYYDCPEDCNNIIIRYECFKYVSYGKPGQKGGDAGIGGFDGINFIPAIKISYL